MGRQVLSERESLPAWQMGTDKRFQYDFIKRTQGMPGPGPPYGPLLHFWKWLCLTREAAAVLAAGAATPSMITLHHVQGPAF